MLWPYLANAKVVGEKNEYKWNINTASLWIIALCHTIKEAKWLASKCHNHTNNTIDSDALHDLVHALTALRFLSYHVPIHQLLSLSSIWWRIHHAFNLSIESLASDD